MLSILICSYSKSHFVSNNTLSCDALVYYYYLKGFNVFMKEMSIVCLYSVHRTKKLKERTQKKVRPLVLKVGT